MVSTKSLSYSKIFSLISNIAKNDDIYKFTVVGVCAASSVLIITWFLNEFLDLIHIFSLAIAVELTFSWGFFAHEKWTFKNQPKKFTITQRFCRYHLIGFVALGIVESFFIFFTMVFGIHYLLAEFLALVLTFVFNYFMNKKFSWGQSIFN